MKHDCEKYKEALLEAALSGNATGALKEHLWECGDCAKELAALRARQEQLDELLPLLARGAEPSPGFRAGVLAAAETKDKREHAWTWRAWALTGACVLVAALATGWTLQRRSDAIARRQEVAAAQKLAEWHAPSDVLLRTTGQEFLRTTPRLGESYLKAAPKSQEE
jgi:hypothetical protein